MPGVVRTRVGYTGGSSEEPTYRSIGDHSEAIEIEYDPGLITYGDLLDLFWEEHDPGNRSWSRQYMTAVFYRDGEQERKALESRDRVAGLKGVTVETAILPAGTFTQAEDYHQKYYLRGESRLLKEYAALYPDPRDFILSTAVARVNGYLGGNGTRGDVEEAIEGLGLSPEGKRRLRELVETTAPRRACPLPLRRGR
jgi:peptide-methionine (S)-S-oxide reductase